MGLFEANGYAYDERRNVYFKPRAPTGPPCNPTGDKCLCEDIGDPCFE